MAKNCQQNLTVTVTVVVYTRLEPAVFSNISLLPLNIVSKVKIILSLKMF